MITGKTQQGISLLEMMVSLTIGVLLLLGLVSIYQVANQSSKTTQILADNAEAARQVFNRLEYDFKRAGFVDLYGRPEKGFTGTRGLTCPSGSFTDKSANVTGKKRYSAVLANKTEKEMGTIYLRWQPSGKSGKTPVLTELNKAFMTPVGYISCGTMRPVFGCANSIEGAPDINVRAECSKTAGNGHSIQIAYQGAKVDSANNLSNLPDNALDCAYDDVGGNKSTLEKTNGFVVNRYFLQEDSSNNNERSFTCMGNKSGNAVTLVPGIQDMAFRYVVTVPEHDANKALTDSDSGSVVTAYKTAVEVEANPLGWSGVVGVEVCLVVGTKLPSGHSNLALNRDQKIRPTCTYEDGKWVDKPKTASDNDRFFERYIRTFSLPNSLYTPIN